MDEDILIPGMFFFTVIVLAIGVPLVRARIRQMDRDAIGPRRDGALDERLGRIEQAIDAMAVEVERIAEGQRFTNKLMADARTLPSPQVQPAWPPAAAPEPVAARHRGEA